MWRDAHVPRVSRCAYSGKTPGNCTENPPSSPPCRDWLDCLAVDAGRSELVSTRFPAYQGKTGRSPQLWVTIGSLATRKHLEFPRVSRRFPVATNRESPGQKQGLARAETGNVCGECPPKTPKTPPQDSGPGPRAGPPSRSDRTGRSRHPGAPPDVGIEGAFWLVPIVLPREPIEHQKRHRETVALTECLYGELHAGRIAQPVRAVHLFPGAHFAARRRVRKRRYSGACGDTQRWKADARYDVPAAVPLRKHDGKRVAMQLDKAVRGPSPS